MTDARHDFEAAVEDARRREYLSARGLYCVLLTRELVDDGIACDPVPFGLQMRVFVGAAIGKLDPVDAAWLAECQARRWP